MSKVATKIREGRKKILRYKKRRRLKAKFIKWRKKFKRLEED